MIDDETQEKLLWERVGEALEPLVGKRLSRVLYWCLGGDVMPAEEWAATAYQYLGGEVEITVEDGASARVIWLLNTQEWRESGHYSLATTREPTFEREALEPFDASDLPVWRLFIGTLLRQIDVVGWENIPYYLKFCFDSGPIYVGVGWRDQGFGDADDTLIRTEDEFKAQMGFVSGDFEQVLLILNGVESEPTS